MKAKLKIPNTNDHEQQQNTFKEKFCIKCISYLSVLCNLYEESCLGKLTKRRYTEKIILTCMVYRKKTTKEFREMLKRL